MKRLFSILVVMVTVLLATTCFATTADVQLNGKIIDFTDDNGNKVEAQIINNRTLVPLRKIFEELGCTVEWEQETRTAIATKEDVKLILQIDNNNVKKIVNGKETTIKLDVPPTIYNNRTLVPLRFIAESLNKQVGWDSQNYTAIIIDYNYFANSLSNKAKYLYEIFENEYKNFDIEITRNYFDELDSSNNNIANIKANVSSDGETYTAKINFSGTNALMKEIAEEKWNDIEFKFKYNASDIQYSTSDVTVAKMLAVAVNEKYNVKYESLNLSGNVNDKFEDVVRNIVGIKENDLNINSFENINSEWNSILAKITYNNLNGDVNFKIAELKDTAIEYFDFTKLDNIIYSNAINKIYNTINKKIFNYDVKLNELMYDSNSITANGTVTNYGKNINVILTFTNEYNEKVVYNIKLNIE